MENIIVFVCLVQTCPTPESVQGQAGWGLEQPDLEEGMGEFIPDYL